MHADVGAKASRKLGFRRAAVAVAGKLAVIMHAMLRSSDLFNRTAAA
jgi:transposase